jgi:membrane-associated phospholipid phosphatase
VVKVPVHDTVLKPHSPGEYIAYGISQIGSPPILGLLPLVLIVTSLALPSIWLWTGVYMLLAIAAPLVFLIWQVVHGHVSDLDIHLREQRKAAMLVTITGFGITWIAMILGHAHPFFTILAGTGFLQWLAIFIITLRWKISVHAASATGITLLLIRMFGSPTAPLLVSIPLVAWSRIKLRHHTPAQTFAGICLGLTIFFLGFILTPAL